MDLQLDDKLALVTASSGGIGKEIAASLAREGATVIIKGRSAASVASAVAHIRGRIPHAKLENRPTSLLEGLIESGEIADLVAFVSNPRSSAINGAALRVDGGLVRSVF